MRRKKFGNEKGNIPLLKHTSAEEFFFHFNDYDACEPYRYYDGIEGCDLREEVLRMRAGRIAERIDCVIDSDDSGDDIDALCSMMGLEGNMCPVYEQSNVRAGGEYGEILKFKHVREILERVSKPYEYLREALMERRCRFMKDGELESVLGFEKANWPQPGCRSL